MTTATAETTGTAGTTAAVPRTRRPAPAPIPFGRLVAVEARKSFDTRSGFWLLASVGITALLATAAVLLWAPAEELTYDTFAAAFGFPMAVILPMIAILSVTSEWSQRSGLTTFTLVPHRGRTVLAKGAVAVVVGVVSMGVAMVIGAVGNLAGTAITGADLVWDISALHLGLIVLGNVLGMLLGFTLGVLIRNSPGAIVTYFVLTFVLSGLSVLLASTQEWFADLQPWVDFNLATGAMFEGLHSGADMAHLATTTLLWVVAPLAVGMGLLLRSEVK